MSEMTFINGQVEDLQVETEGRQLRAPIVLNGPTSASLEVVGVISSILAAIDAAQTILVTSHARPDGDAIGSTLALGMLLEQLGKNVKMVMSDRVPLLYRWLPCAEHIEHTEEVSGDYDLAILLECDGLERSRLKGLEGQRIINIDHHASGRSFAEINWIDPQASAVAELVFATGSGRQDPGERGHGHLPVHGFAHGYGLLLLRRHGCTHAEAGDRTGQAGGTSGADCAGGLLQ